MTEPAYDDGDILNDSTRCGSVRIVDRDGIAVLKCVVDPQAHDVALKPAGRTPHQPRAESAPLPVIVWPRLHLRWVLRGGRVAGRVPCRHPAEDVDDLDVGAGGEQARRHR